MQNKTYRKMTEEQYRDLQKFVFCIRARAGELFKKEDGWEAY